VVLQVLQKEKKNKVANAQVEGEIMERSTLALMLSCSKEMRNGQRPDAKLIS
jgi:hypothetical protein